MLHIYSAAPEGRQKGWLPISRINAVRPCDDLQIFPLPCPARRQDGAMITQPECATRSTISRHSIEPGSPVNTPSLHAGHRCRARSGIGGHSVLQRSRREWRRVKAMLSRRGHRGLSSSSFQREGGRAPRIVPPRVRPELPPPLPPAPPRSHTATRAAGGRQAARFNGTGILRFHGPGV